MVFSVAAAVYLKTSQAALDEAMATRLVSLAQVVAGEMRPDYLQRLEPGDEHTRLYRLLMKQLVTLKNNAGLDDVFIVDHQGKVLIDVDEEIPIGREYLFLKLDAVELARVWQGESIASTLYSSADGHLYKSGYAPITDKDGTVFAAVGVEAGAGFLGAVQKQRRNVLWLIAAAMAMTGIVSAAVARSIVGPIKRMVEAIGEVKGDGTYPTVQVTTHDEVGYLSEAFNNMTDRLKEKDKELTRLYELERARAERIEDLSGLVFEGIPNGIIAVDLSARVLLCNQAAARIASVEGYPFPDTGIPPDAKDVLTEDNPVLGYLMISLEENRQFQLENAPFVQADGSEGVLGISSFPLADRDGHPMGAIAIFSDLTQVTRLQDQIKINERLAALGELAAGVAHEIRNPLGAIRGFVELLDRRLGDDKRGHGIVTNVLKEIVALNNIVTDFLTFARDPAPVPTPTDTARLIQEAIQVAVPEPEPGETAKATVQLTLADAMPQVILDEGQVKKALVNVMQNGINAMGGEGVLNVEAIPEHGGITFRISDSGPGIPEAVRDKIFNPFFTTRAEGTGLGLSIVNKVVQSHGGRIQVENTQQGARFTLWFPSCPALPLAPGDTPTLPL
jgi:nitrogen fixation/metabolism regulation signal transduction histidine kinase